MAGGLAPTFDIETAWEAATTICAVAFGVDARLLLAPSRGRGPRPPEPAREPKKLAVYLTITMTGGDYAALARHIGLHKDTVGSHCADLRDRCAEDVETEARVDALLVAAMHRAAAREQAADRGLPPDHDVTRKALALSVDARLDRIEKLLLHLAAHPRVHPTETDEKGLHPSDSKDHGNVIAFPGTTGADA